MTTKVFLKFCVISLLSFNSFLILCVNKNDSKNGQYYLSFHNGFNNNEVEIYFDGVFQVKTVLSTLPQVGVATSSESLPLVPKCTKVIALQVPEL